MKKLSEKEKKESFERLVNAYYAAKSKSEQRRLEAIIKAVRPDWKPF